MMNELEWQTVLYAHKNIEVPKERWGHRIVKAGDQLLMFGGYGGIKQGAGSYLNDLWSFNLNTYRWEQLTTKGDLPQARSNYTIHYWAEADEVIVFGGGSDNKKRFNSISILDVETLTWRTISPEPTDQAPWERTYHSAQLYEQYLMVFGGEGAAGIDLDDLWVFDLNEEKWMKLQPKGNCPERRRFGSSVMVNSDLYIIGGCKDYYKQIGDCHKLSLLPLRQGRPHQLKWQTIFENNKLLERWGHSANVHEGSIYIFAGRIKSAIDDSQLMEFDCRTGLLSKVKTFGKVPNPRRRHATVMLGDCLLVFGGYNDLYYNDFSFIKLPKKASTVAAFQIDGVKSAVEYEMAIAKYQMALASAERLKVVARSGSAYVPTFVGRLREQNVYFNRLFKYEKELILPEFCTIELARIVLISIINKRSLIWSSLPLPQCIQLIQAFEYFCCEDLRMQMELHLMKRVTPENALTIIQEAIIHKLAALANHAASVHLAAYQDQAMSYVSFNKNQPNMLNKILAVLEVTEGRMKFQLDQAHIQTSKADVATKVINFFKYLVCKKQKPLKRIKGIPKYNKLTSSTSTLLQERNYINPDQYS